MNQQLEEMIADSRNLVFLGGAGVSTESGIPDFRSVDGLYHQQWNWPPEQILSHEFFNQHPEEFYRFYRAKLLALDAKPNPAHLRLAQLEREGKLRAVITQNIDGLHQAAGSSRVLELHGSIWRNHCTSCGKAWGIQAITQSQGVPRCNCGGIIKPDVVLYGEPLDDRVIRQAINALEGADLLIVGGTSLTVYPAAGLLAYYGGRKLVVINKTPTSADRRADLVLTQPIGQVLNK